jgi:hypothetical protein
MVLNRKGADARRNTPAPGRLDQARLDRDEYPADIGRGKANGNQHGLVRGDQSDRLDGGRRYVRSSENRSQGASPEGEAHAALYGTTFEYTFV